MAEGILRHLYGDRYEAFSAGIIETKVHPLAIQVLKEIGIDISHHTSKTIDEFKDMAFEYVVTVCDHARETCPFFPGKTIIHQSFDDPGQITTSSEEMLFSFRAVRDEIKQFIEERFA